MRGRTISATTTAAIGSAYARPVLRMTTAATITPAITKPAATVSSVALASAASTSGRYSPKVRRESDPARPAAVIAASVAGRGGAEAYLAVRAIRSRAGSGPP
ncbi:hypothetical protein FHX34_102195 [Actinoplanes teichomyceticus]|uniref:Uncharacterized protein n=1 Tax=Actinoplanes teichomyceticus TaxID=1867 RepID=A0A561WIF7_ACTTI|nr:hypothetical protein FHX34_102195 [Actinoplanes teichomyceticus]